MTEGQWLIFDDPYRLRGFALMRMNDRKRRLFACALCRWAWHLFTNERHRRQVEQAEAYADRLIDSERYGYQVMLGESETRDPIDEAAEYAARSVVEVRVVEDAIAQALIAEVVGSGQSNQAIERDRMRRQVQKGICHLFRDLVGNPFRPVAIAPSWLRWNDDCVVKIAQSIYDERRFDDMPILADALEDAGCDNEDILIHCRSQTPHARGCWVVDLLLGKE